MHPSQALFQEQVQPLFLPVCDHYAGSEKLMRKSLSLQKTMGPVFDITLDCEDGASIGNELEHIRLITELLNSDDNAFNRVGVRIHDVNSPFFQSDIDTLLANSNNKNNKLAYIVIPKVSDFQQVDEAIKRINFASNQQLKSTTISSTAPVPVHILIETQSALAEVQKIASHPQVECLSFGIMDFVSSHFGAIPASAMHTPEQFSHPLVMRAKVKIAAACHLYGKVASHNVTTEFKDLNVVKNDATSAKQECGYTRMWSIHPHQISPIIDAMTPSFIEINEAIAILSAATSQQWGPIDYLGRLYDRASYRYYWSILKKAQLSGVTLSDSALVFL